MPLFFFYPSFQKSSPERMLTVQFEVSWNEGGGSPAILGVEGNELDISTSKKKKV